MACTPKSVCYLVSNELVKYSSLLPSNRNRSLLVHSLVKAFKLLDNPEGNDQARLHILRPAPADVKDLTRYHDRDYIDFLLSLANMSSHCTPDSSLYAEYGLEEDCSPFPGLAEYARLIGGASLADTIHALAAESLNSGRADIAICWDGGRHHAQKSRASGFCYVADCILAILLLKRARPAPSLLPHKSRIMYLDLDLHFSDAVSHAFSSASDTSASAQVITLSIHYTAPGFFPASNLATLPDISDPLFDPFTLSLPLHRGASDGTFAQIWPCVEAIKDAFQPTVVVVQCGVDGLSGDPNGIWNWSLGGSDGSFGWCMSRILKWDCKLLLLGGGGYHSPNAARAWTFLTAIAVGKRLPIDADIPDHAAFPLYEPSFTLDVPAGNARDENTPEYLQVVSDRFQRVADILRQSLGPTASGDL